MYVVELAEIPENITNIPSVKRVLESDIHYPDGVNLYLIGTGALTHALKHDQVGKRVTSKQHAKIDEIAERADTDLMFCPTASMIELHKAPVYPFIQSVEKRIHPNKSSAVPAQDDLSWFKYTFFNISHEEENVDYAFQKLEVDRHLLCSGQVFINLKTNQMVFADEACYQHFLKREIYTPHIEEIVNAVNAPQLSQKMIYLIRLYLKLMHIGFTLSEHDREQLVKLQANERFIKNLNTKITRLFEQNGRERYEYIDEMKSTLDDFDGTLIDLILQYDSRKADHLRKLKQKSVYNKAFKPKTRTPKYLLAAQERDEDSLLRYNPGDSNLQEIILRAKNKNVFIDRGDAKEALKIYFADALAHCQNTGASATECAYTALQLHEAYHALSKKLQDETLLKRLRSAAGIKPQTPSPTATATTSPVINARSAPVTLDHIFYKMFASLDASAIKSFNLPQARRSDAQVMVHYHEAKSFHTQHTMLRARTGIFFAGSFLLIYGALGMINHAMSTHYPESDERQLHITNIDAKAFTFSSMMLFLTTIWTYASNDQITRQLAFKSAVERLDNIISKSPDDEQSLLHHYAICLALAEKVESPESLIQVKAFGFPKKLNKDVFFQLTQTVSITHKGFSGFPEVRPIVELLIKVVNYKNIEHNQNREKPVRLSALDVFSQDVTIIRNIIATPEPKKKNAKYNGEPDVNARFKSGLEKLSKLIIAFHSKLNAGHTREIRFDDLEQYAILLYELQLDVKFEGPTNLIKEHYLDGLKGHEKLFPGLYGYLARNTKDLPKPATIFSMWSHPLKAYLETTNYRQQFIRDLENFKKMERPDVSAAVHITRKHTHSP